MLKAFEKKITPNDKNWAVFDTSVPLARPRRSFEPGFFVMPVNSALLVSDQWSSENNYEIYTQNVQSQTEADLNVSLSNRNGSLYPTERHKKLHSIYKYRLIQFLYVFVLLQPAHVQQIPNDCISIQICCSNCQQNRTHIVFQSTSSILKMTRATFSWRQLRVSKEFHGKNLERKFEFQIKNWRRIKRCQQHNSGKLKEFH